MSNSSTCSFSAATLIAFANFWYPISGLDFRLAIYSLLLDWAIVFAAKYFGLVTVISSIDARVDCSIPVWTISIITSSLYSCIGDNFLASLATIPSDCPSNLIIAGCIYL